MQYTLEKTDMQTKARAGFFETAHGVIQTPVFMPVGTQGTVKGMSPDELEDINVQMILGNTYHLFLRPGDDLVREAGGLHAFSGWRRPILTDSGGYQVFSLATLRKVTDEGVRFQSHIDGSHHVFTPEKAIDIQRNLGTDVMMVLDECVGYPSTLADATKAHERTLRWAERCQVRFTQTEPPHGLPQSLFAIVQGSVFDSIRRSSAESLVAADFDGYAIGGLAVGEPRSAMLEMTDLCTDSLPESKPRYLMGVGKPHDILDSIALGVDMFDCVIPTRNGRNGTVYTWQGKMNIRNQQYEHDFLPIDKTCPCPACQTFSRAYIRHLFQANEILGLRLATLHNLCFYTQLIEKARKAILDNQFGQWKQSIIEQLTPSFEEASID